MGKRVKINESLIRKIIREAYKELSYEEEEALYTETQKNIAKVCMEKGTALPFTDYSDYHDFCVWIKRGCDPNCMDEPLAEIGLHRRPDKSEPIPAGGGYTLYYTDLSDEDFWEYMS